MALTRITKGVIKPNENYDTHNINSTGIVTAIGLDVNGNGDISGNLSVGGVLTYEDVTSIDSVGLITARDGIFLPDNKKLEFGNQAGSSDFRIYHDGTRNVLAGFTARDINIESYHGADVNIITNSNHYAIKCISNAQVELYHDNVKRLETSATGVSIPQDLDVDGHTELDNVNIAGVATFSQGGSEVVRINSSGLLVYNDVSFFGASTHAYWDKSANQFSLNDNTKLSVGSGSDLQIFHDSNNSYIENSTNSLFIRSDTLQLYKKSSSERYIVCSADAAVKLFYDNALKLETSAKGIQVGTGVTIETNGQATFTGIVTASTYYGDGSNLSNITSTTINSNTNNYIITGTGTANTLQGESGLTYNGSTLALAGSLAMTGGSISLDSHSLISTAGFTDISGGSYAARLGSTGTSTIRSTQIYGGGNHIATFDGVNYRLGIYETTPEAGLHITGGLPSIRLENSGTSASANDIFGQIDFKHNDSSDAGVTAAIKCVAEDANGNSFLAFYNGDGGNADERLRIDSSGNVGIDQTNPAAYGKFVVNGTGNIINLRASSGAAGLGFFEAGTGRFYIKTLNGSDGLSFVDGDNSSERLRIKSDGKIEVPTTGKLSLGMSSPVAQFTAGTANGSRVIEIQGTDGVIRGYNRNSSAWAQIDFEASSYSFDCGGTERLRIHSDGKISTGVNNNSYELTIGGLSGGPTLWLRDSGTTGTSRILFGDTSAATKGAIYYSSNNNYMALYTNGTEHIRINSSGHFYPYTDATRDLGTSSLRWRNVYTTDLQLSNENTGGNEVDGTEGNWTLQEGESDVYMINRKTGKKYKMMLQEVN